MATKRRFSERMLLVVNLAVANGVAALWIVTFLQPGVVGADVGATSPALADGGRGMVVPLQTPAAWLAFLLSVGLLLWNFAWIVRPRAPRVQSGWIVSETASGPVRVAREAVEAGLRVAGEALPEVTRLRVQVTMPAARRLLLVGQFHCAEGQDHLRASQRLRQAMLERFAHLVKLADGARAELELEFQGFLGKVDRSKPEPAPPAEPEGEPFRGPQYPIDDDEQ